MVNNRKQNQKDQKEHIYKPKFVPSQPTITGKNKNLGWLSWLGIGISVLLTIASFGFTGPVAGVVIGLTDAAAQLAITAAQSDLTIADIAINSAIAILPLAQALRVSSKGAAAFSIVESKLNQKGKIVEGFTLSKNFDNHVLEVGGQSIQITGKQSQALRSFAKLDLVSNKVTYNGTNSAGLIKVALSGDIASGALGKTTRQIFNPIAEDNWYKLYRVYEGYLQKNGVSSLGNLSKADLRILSKELQAETKLSQTEVGYFLREKLPSTKLDYISRSDLKGLSFSERQKILINRRFQKYRFGKITKGVIDIRTGKIKWVNVTMYYKFIQALHFLDPKLAARKILTKMQYYAKKSAKRWFRQSEFTIAKRVTQKWDKFINSKLMRPFTRAIRQRMGVLIKEIEEEMFYFPESIPVRGIRVIPLLGNKTMATIIVFFKPRPTHNKPPVVLSARPISEVVAWLHAPSKMGYYLDTYAFSRGGVRLGFAVRGSMGALLGILPLGLLRAHLSLSSNIVKLGKMISEGKYGEEWKDIWKTFERLGPHKLGKFVFGRYGLAIVRGFQRSSNKTGRTTFSFSNEFKWEPLQESLFRKTTSKSRSAQNSLQKQWRREQRFVEQYSRIFTQGANLNGKSTRRKRSK